MRVCRADDQAQQYRQRESRNSFDQSYSSPNDMYRQQQQPVFPQYQQQQMYSNYPNMYDQQQQQQQYMNSPR